MGARSKAGALKNGNIRGSSMAKITYKHSKVIGRIGKTGGVEPVSLKPIHKEIITMHLQCKSIKEIAKKTHYSQGYISLLLSSKAAKPILDIFHNVIDQDIRALAGKAVETLGDAMKDGTISERTTAAREVLKLNDRYPKDDDSKGDGQNAAEIVQSVIDLARDVMDVRKVDRNPQAQIIDVESKLIEE